MSSFGPKHHAAIAWANISGNNSPSLDDSFNVASLTDTGTGGVRYNWSNNAANSNYACLHGVMQDGNTNGNRGASGTQLESVATSSLTVTQMYGSTESSPGSATGSAAHDSIAIMGDVT